LDKRQARLRKGQNPNLVDWRKMLKCVVRVVSAGEEEMEMRIAFSGALGQQEGSDRQSGRSCWEHSEERSNVFLRCNDLWSECLHCCDPAATQKQPEQQNKRFGDHEISLLCDFSRERWSRAMGEAQGYKRRGMD
jgi:hypothetical protein